MVTIVAWTLLVIAFLCPLIHERYFNPQTIAARHERQERRAKAFDKVWNESWTDEDYEDFNRKFK